MKKKLYAVISLALVFAFLLAGCGKSADKTDGTRDTQEAAKQTSQNGAESKPQEQTGQEERSGFLNTYGG